MSSPVITVSPTSPAHRAAALLVTHGYSGAPVVDRSGKLVGMVTEADLIRGQIPSGSVAGGAPARPSVAQVMSRPATRVCPHDELADAAALMIDTRSRAIPVVEAGRLVGILTRRDVLRVVASAQLTPEFGWRSDQSHLRDHEGGRFYV
jgi:CBS domain-containing protein